MKYYSFASGVMATPECEKSFHNSIFTAEMYFVDKCWPAVIGRENFPRGGRRGSQGIA